jgi:hypothetical protein
VPNKSKGRGQTKCSTWSSRLGVGRGAKNHTLEKSVTKPPETMQNDRRLRPIEDCSPSKEEKRIINAGHGSRGV